jgi:high-affinity iron transporter
MGRGRDCYADGEDESTLRSGPLHALALAAVAAIVCLLLAIPSRAADNSQTILNLLDYVSVEYPEFVSGGVVRDEAEYAEQVEFSTQILTLLVDLPVNPQREGLLRDANELIALVHGKGDGARVAALARGMQRRLIEAYALQVTPARAPQRAGAEELYAANCAGCHGVRGDGAGPAAQGLDPAPTDFRDPGRASARSVYGLYNTITLGVAGTAMAAFSSLSDEQRWQLAFYVSQFSASDALRVQGEQAWRQGQARERFPGLVQVVLTTPAEARSTEGGESVLAYLRSNPGAVATDNPTPVQFAIATLERSLEAWRARDARQAYQLAVTAYLEGFELVEARLEPALRSRTEQALMAYRHALDSDAAPAQVEEHYRTALALLHEAQGSLGTAAMTAPAAFASSMIIILREGLEAILVLSAMGAFLVRTERRGALRWLHAGWALALLAGALTWFVSSKLIAISGAQREVTEGVTALLSAAVLIYVGFWLHSKASATRWSSFIRARMSSASGTGFKAAFAIALVAFLAVYREVFETVLFYQALWLQAGLAARGALLAGFAAGVLGLTALAWVLIRASVRLPLGLFFGASALLLAALAVVFAGQGVAALQAAGKLPVYPVSFPSVPLLGIYPSLQGLLLQLGLVALIAAGWYFTRDPARRA